MEEYIYRKLRNAYLIANIKKATKKFKENIETFVIRIPFSAS